MAYVPDNDNNLSLGTTSSSSVTITTNDGTMGNLYTDAADCISIFSTESQARYGSSGSLYWPGEKEKPKCFLEELRKEISDWHGDILRAA